MSRLKSKYHIAILIEDVRFGKIAGIRNICTETSAAALVALPKKFSAAEINILLAGDEMVRKLNKKFRGKDSPTNVLSFPSGEMAGGGDIILAFETLQREAATQGKKFADHLRHLLIHAVLHLAGYDHGKAMEKLEIKLLKSYGIKNPYII